MKRCGACRQFKPLPEFHRRGNGRQTWCVDCRRTYDAAYHLRTRERRLFQKRQRHEEFMEWYRELKTNRPCADCGGTFHHAAMTWDHLPGAVKLAHVSELIWHRSKRRVLAEIEKCELVCSNCHAVRTFSRQRGVAQPG